MENVNVKQNASFLGNGTKNAVSVLRRPVERGKPFLSAITSGKVSVPPVRTLAEAAATSSYVPRSLQHPRCRVLFLHGGGSSACIQEDSLSWTLLQLPARAMLADMLDMSFMDAPFPCSMMRDLTDFYPATIPCYSWFDGKSVSSAVDTVVNHCKQYGPFDGIMGFSQGSVMTQIMLAMQHRGEVPTQFKFGIGIGGPSLDYLGSLEHNVFSAALKDNVSIPIAYLYNDDDIVAFKPPRASKETKYFSNVLVANGEMGGHAAPRLVGADLEAVCAFIRSSMKW